MISSRPCMHIRDRAVVEVWYIDPMLRIATLIVAGLITNQLVLGQVPTPDQRFADIFAAVLKGENPDGGKWGNPSQYLAASSTRTVPSGSTIKQILQTPINQYGVLIVPGFLSACAASISASASVFKQAQDHLRSKHGVDISSIQVPDDSTENNANFIISHLPAPKTAGEKYILIGHSKGVPDLQTALQNGPLKSLAAAFVSVAGAIHGTPLAILPGGPDLLANMETRLGCAGKVVPALQSLNPDARLQFLNAHPSPQIPSWSLVAESSITTTSRFLVGTWFLLGAGSRPEDGLLIAADGTLNGFTSLGTALGDHVAVAHNFQGTRVAELFDQGSFPRVALLEALVRYVAGDLSSAKAGH